jgi:OFA family oxalate/formate antiporter-like MFS transporter
VLYTVAIMDLTAACLAMMVLRPVLASHVATARSLHSKEMAATGAQVPA